MEDSLTSSVLPPGDEVNRARPSRWDRPTVFRALFVGAFLVSLVINIGLAIQTKKFIGRMVKAEQALLSQELQKNKADVLPEAAAGDAGEAEVAGMIEYLESDVLPKYPELQAEIQNRKIRRVYGLGNPVAGLMVEGDNQPENDEVLPSFEYIIKTDGTWFGLPVAAGCELTGIEPVTSEEGTQTTLTGDRLLIQRHCQYGGRDQVALFNLTTGEQIPFTAPTIAWIDSGSIQGRLSRDFSVGVDRIVVQRDNQLGVFSLETGRFVQAIDFDTL